MQFLYNPQGGLKELLIKGEEYRYLFKVHRLKSGDKINIRNLKDQNLYLYEIQDIQKKEANLKLIDQKEKICAASKEFHIIWCVIDTKIVEKTIPVLNQMGLKKISFVYCDRSQRNFKIDLNRLKKILINSSQQCGRSDILEMEIIQSVDETLLRYEDIFVLDFGGAQTNWIDIKRIFIGCEGGFSQRERKIFLKYPKISFQTDFILKSEAAAIATCAKLLI